MSKGSRMFVSRVAIGLAALLGWAGSAALAATWNGGAGAWTDPTKWTPGVPGPNDDVSITVAGSQVTLAAATSIRSLVLSQMLVFTNWTTSLTVQTDVSVENGGNITLPAAYGNGVMSNRVYIVCSNLTVKAGGKIDANAKGYAGGRAASTPGNGPGAGSTGQSGAGHGGTGGLGGGVYDSLTLPVSPGSGGGCTYYPDWPGGTGGGAVYIDASGYVTVNGTIDASGSPQSAAGGRWSAGGGSGGAIYLHCHTLAGTNGTVLANGGYGGWLGSAEGAGGRIAVVVDAAAQSVVPSPRITFSAMNFDGTSGQRGTVYLSDNSALSTIFASGGCRVFGTSPSWSLPSLTLSNAYVTLEQSPLSLAVSGRLAIMGGSATTGRLDIGTTGNLGFGALTCDSLVVTNRGSLYVFSGLGMTTGGAANVGAMVAVTRDISVGSNSWICPVSHPTNGGSVLFRAANVRIAASGGFLADRRGFDGGAQSLNGFGTGKGSGAAGGAAGAGYGGVGKAGSSGTPGGIAYGDEWEPVDPGSGGGGGGYEARDAGGYGGGLVRIEAPRGTVQVDGQIRANGGRPKIDSSRPGGGGSGGGIYIRCKSFAGGSSSQTNLQAHGAGGGYIHAGAWGGGGGGGRIAVWRMRDEYQGQAAAAGGVTDAGTPARNGATGTVHFVLIPPTGTTIVLQ